MPSLLKPDLVRYAHSLGFERVGVTSAEPLKKDEAFLNQWLEAGRAGEMDYLERDPERRSRPMELLPGAKSVIALAMNYFVPSPTLRPDEPGEGRIARYALGKDYHKVINKRLESFVRYLEALAPGALCHSFVDTGPLLERAFAQRAGIGFIGKNTMLITKGLGSWVFLASVITSLELPMDAPDERSCGTCRLCIDACPTEAITAPFELDARRCISYLTIESEKPPPTELRVKMGEWVFGCDICQEVCPHNARPSLTVLDAFKPESQAQLTLSRLLAMRDDKEFKTLFAGTPLIRTGREGLVRNACIAAANLGRRDLMPQLDLLSREDPHEEVREQASWAFNQLR